MSNTVTVKHGMALSGALEVPPSKSCLHRYLILAALSGGNTALFGAALCRDTEATLGCIRSLGAKAEYSGGVITVTPIISPVTDVPSLYCGESGSTLRFILPLAAALGRGRFFTGAGLAARPVMPLAAALCGLGAKITFAPYKDSNTPVIEIESGVTRGGEATLPGNVSSQFISGMLLSLPLMPGVSLRITGDIESAGYIRLTESLMREFGVDPDNAPFGEKFRYSTPGRINLPGDWSAAAPFMAAAAINGDITFDNLDPDSVQSDRAILDILAAWGAGVSTDGRHVRITAGRITPCDIDCAQTPDIVPVLALLACAGNRPTGIKGIGRLRYKESDRIKTTVAGLRALGADITSGADFIRVTPSRLTGGTAFAADDHRIAMMLSVAAALADGDITVQGADSVGKSYPGFFDDIAALGADII